MLSHILLILALFLQPMSMALASVSGTGSQHGMALSMTQECCVPVVTTQSCCGESVIVEIICPESDGPCQCDMQRHEAPADLPVPMLWTGHEIAPAFLLALQRGVVSVLPVRPCARSIRTTQHAGTNHNRIQAFLGIWRT